MKNLDKQLLWETTEKQKNQIDLILSGYTYYRNTGKRWTKTNLLNEVSELLGGNGACYSVVLEEDGVYNELVKKQYNKEQLATLYILNK